MPDKTQGYLLFERWVNEFIQHHDSTPEDGEYYDMPGVVVYHTYRQPLAGKGRIEVHQVTPDAQANFHWRTEITLDDLEAGIYKHILLQTDNTVVETYGKNVHSVDDTAAQKLLNLIVSGEASALEG